MLGIPRHRFKSGVRHSQVTLIAARGLLKGAANVMRLSRNLQSFDIVEQVRTTLFPTCHHSGISSIEVCVPYISDDILLSQAFDEISGPNTEVLEGQVSRVDAKSKHVILTDGRQVPYDKLCICTGARPREARFIAEPTVSGLSFHIRVRKPIQYDTKTLSEQS